MQNTGVELTLKYPLAVDDTEDDALAMLGAMESEIGRRTILAIPKVVLNLSRTPQRGVADAVHFKLRHGN